MLTRSMSTKRIKCVECDNLILPATAAANDGLCAQCASISPKERQEGRAFDHALARGALWKPSHKERATARTPPSLAHGTWNLDPDYYEDEPRLSVREAVERAAAGQLSEVFLVSDSGSRLLVSLNSKYGVCEFQDEKQGDQRYAHSEENLQSQVPGSLHLSQSCHCCGVGTGWYPSRAHMPRAVAIKLLWTIADRSTIGSPQEAQWIELGDISRYFKGRG